jgi:hypothetical protein
MGVTARNFVGSFYDKERLTTIQYPEERAPLPENYRNFPFLVHDGDDAHVVRELRVCLGQQLGDRVGHLERHLDHRDDITVAHGREA